MKRILFVGVIAIATSRLFAGGGVVEGFAVPGTYTDGQDVAAAAAPADASKPGTAARGPAKPRWQLDEKLEKQVAGTFLARKAADQKAPGATAAAAKPLESREELAKKRKEEREKLRALPKEEREKKAEEAARLEQAERAIARIKTIPGQLELVAGQAGEQSILLKLPKAIEPPFFASVILTPDDEQGGPIDFAFEDENGNSLVSAGITQGKGRTLHVNGRPGIKCEEITGPLHMIFGIDYDKNDAKVYLARIAVQPTNAANPFQQPFAGGGIKIDGEISAAARFRISKGGKVKGTIDDIRIGAGLRDVMP